MHTHTDTVLLVSIAMPAWTACAYISTAVRSLSMHKLLASQRSAGVFNVQVVISQACLASAQRDAAFALDKLLQ